MHDDLEPFSQSPSQKFHKNSTNFENPKKILKTQNLYLNALNAWRMRDKEHTRRKKNDLEAEKLLGREFEVRKKGFGRWKDTKVSREIEKSEIWIVWILFIDSYNSRLIERCRALKVRREIAIEQLSRGVYRKMKLDGSRSYRATIKKTETFSMDWGAIEKLSRLWLKEAEELDR